MFVQKLLQYKQKQSVKESFALIIKVKTLKFNLLSLECTETP